MKICSKCGKDKINESFHKNPKSADGLRGICRLCDRFYKLMKMAIKPSPEEFDIKKCTQCLEIKRKTEFNRSSSTKDLLQYNCRDCTNKKRQIWAKDNPDKVKGYEQKWKTENPEYQKNWKKNNPEKYKASRNNWEKNNPGKKEEYQKKWREANPEKYLLQINIYAASHKKEKAIYDAIYAKENPGKRNSATMKRLAVKMKATLSSLTESHINQIEQLYTEAARLTKETGIKHQVDHILPLQGSGITGLHVPWNLQILTFEENRQKSNKFDFTYDNEGWRQ